MVKDLQKTTITTENTEALRAHRGINSTTLSGLSPLFVMLTLK